MQKKSLICTRSAPRAARTKCDGEARIICNRLALAAHILKHPQLLVRQVRLSAPLGRRVTPPAPVFAHQVSKATVISLIHSLKYFFWEADVWFDTGIISLISLAVLSYERYCTMTRMTEADTTNYRKSWTGIILSWTYSLFWTVPPLLGWSSYGPEGPGITCSVNWHSKDANNASYIVCLFIFCLVIPFVIIVYSYGKLFCAVRQVSQWLSCLLTVTPKEAERILVMVLVMVVCFLLCWLPYAAVALIATFGKPGLISPAASIVPAILAKSSTVYNPIIYVFLNKQVQGTSPSFTQVQCVQGIKNSEGS
uniref:G-protein coupled receptors family 1 profile domain-containing protein n=1 Tax=Malurus cyaneus samueli TaxID=2593467 RepID=A0A8C5TPE2_9PASS